MPRLRTAFLTVAFLAALLGFTGLGASTAQDKKMEAGVVFEVYKDKAGEFRFRLKNGDDILATSSKGYENKADCLKVVELIRKEAAKAKVAEEAKK